MMNKDDQQKLCTDPKSTVAENIRFAIAYEEGTIRQQSFDQLDKPLIKTEVNARNNVYLNNKRWGPPKKFQMQMNIYTPTPERR